MLQITLTHARMNNAAQRRQLPQIARQLIMKVQLQRRLHLHRYVLGNCRVLPFQ